MPVQLQSLAYDFQMYYFLQTYSKFWLEYPIVFLSSRHVQEEMDDTFYRSFGFPLEYQSKQLYHPIPDELIRHKTLDVNLQKSLVLMLLDLKEELVYFSYQHAHCTTVLEVHFLLNKFYKGSLCLA